jgi:hypothetical protein
MSQQGLSTQLEGKGAVKIIKTGKAAKNLPPQPPETKKWYSFLIFWKKSEEKKKKEEEVPLLDSEAVEGGKTEVE